MVASSLYIDNAWTWTTEDPNKPTEQRFFEAYGRSVDSLTFTQTPMTKYYSPQVIFRSETGKLFHGAEEMKTWMKELFFSFERIRHVPEYYVQYKTAEGVTKVHAQFRRLLWLKGNNEEEPDTDTPVAWVCEIGKADDGDGDGYLGLQFMEVNLYWDKTKTVELLKKALPSDL